MAAAQEPQQGTVPKPVLPDAPGELPAESYAVYGSEESDPFVDHLLEKTTKRKFWTGKRIAIAIAIFLAVYFLVAILLYVVAGIDIFEQDQDASTQFFGVFINKAWLSSLLI